MYITLQMAGLEVVIGVLFSLPFALLGASNTTPHRLVRSATKMLVTTFRTIPDLIWALIFVIIVGPGVLAGILPEAFPSFVATSLFGVEKAIRSVIILATVIVIEQISSHIRKKVME